MAFSLPLSLEAIDTLRISVLVGRDLVRASHFGRPNTHRENVVMLATFLAAASIDVDITALVMAALFLVLYFILQPLILNPYMRARELRHKAVEGAREDAREDQAMAEARIQEYEEEMRQARRDAQEVRESIRTQGVAEQNEIVEDARVELQAKLAEEREKVQKQVDAATTQLQVRAESLSKTMVEKILPAIR